MNEPKFATAAATTAGPTSERIARMPTIGG